MTLLRINLLGPPQILRDEELVNHNLSQKALGLLAYLAMCPSRGYTRQRLSGMFWGETDEEHATFNLRRALWSLRKVINPPDAPSNRFIRYRQGFYSFKRSSDYANDVNAFEMAVNNSTFPSITSALKHSSSFQAFDGSGTKNLHGAVKLYRGKLLEGCNPPKCPEFMDWLFLERNRLEQQFIKCLRKLAVERAIQNEYLQAIAYYEQILSVDPLHEVTQCDLMVAYYVLGKRDKAVEQFLGFQRVLRQRLKLEPLPETKTLYLDIRSGTLTIEGSSYWLASTQKSAAQATPSGPFIGREPEQIKLKQILKSTMQDEGCLAVVSGEPGVGKTRLIEEFLHQQTEFPITVLRARCYAQEQGLPYQPIIDALRTYLSFADFSYLKDLSNLWLAEIAKLLPELHGYLPHLPVSLALFPDQERNRLFEGIAQFITHLSQREALILFLDDIHAADLPTFELIHYLARRLSAARVLILCSLRKEALADRPNLSVLLRELARSGHLVTIPLARLSEKEVLELINQTYGKSVKLTELGHHLYLETGGNPFYLVEMLKAREEGQGGITDDLTVPSNVRDVIRHRLNRLDEESRYIVTMASVIGRQFRSTTLQQVYDGDQENLLGVLDRLLLRDWIIEPPGVNPGTYDFSHGLVREAVYQTLSAERRQGLHRRVGLALEDAVSESDELAGILAHHFLKANDTGKGVHYALQAASHARRLYANGEAIAHYQRVLDIANKSKAIFSTTEALDIQCQLGQCYEFLGKYDDAIAVYKAALPDINLSKPSHRRIYFQLAIAYDRKGEYDQALEFFNAIGTHLSEPNDPASRIEAAMNARGRARVYLHREQSHQALAFCKQALELVSDDEANDDEFNMAYQLAAERVAVYEIMANSYFNLGNYEAAVKHYLLALEIAQKQDQRHLAARLLIGLGKVARRRGNYVQAGDYARESQELCRAIGHISGEAASLGLLGDVAYNRGDFKQAISCYEGALSTFRQLGDQHAIADYCLSLAFVKIDKGENDEAEDYLQEALIIGHNLNATLVLIRAQYHLARVARARGHLDQAQDRVERALEGAQIAGIRLLEAAGHHLLGDILPQKQQPAQGERHLIKGLRLFESLGDRFETAWTLRSYARLLTQRGDLSYARPQLQRAAALFAELGAQRELIRTNNELALLDSHQK